MARLSRISVVRILALALGFLPAAFFLLFLLGEGFAELIDGKTGVIPIVLMMLFTVSGYILAWKRPQMGGIIMISGGFVMGIYLLITGGVGEWQMALAYSVPFMLPGFLFTLLKKLRTDLSK